MNAQFVNLKPTLLAALLVAALLAGWIVLSQTPSSSQTPTPDERLAEKIRHFNAVKNQPPQMTQAEIDAKRDRHLASYEAFKANYAAWLDELEASEVDLRSLTWEDDQGNLTGPLTLDEAVGGPSRIVVSGVVKSIDFSAPNGTPVEVVRLDVEETLAGTPERTIEFHIPGGPWRKQSGEVVVRHNPALPLLFAGDRAIVIVDSQGGGALWPVPGWGVVKVEGQSVNLPQGRRFVTERYALDDGLVSDYTAKLMEAIDRTRGP
jgi:hypothetical protein